MDTFVIAPAANRWFVIVIGVVLIGVLAALIATVRGSMASTFEVRDDGLALKGDFYGRFIPKAQLKLNQARRVDLSHDATLRPKWRWWGTGLPGYQAGWFKLNNGEKALLYLTDRSRAVYVPTTQGYSLLLSPLDPDSFLTSLLRTDPPAETHENR